MSAARSSSEGRMRARLGPWALVIYGILAFAFLYLPIIIVVIFSFNDSRSTAQWLTSRTTSCRAMPAPSITGTGGRPSV